MKLSFYHPKHENKWLKYSESESESSTPNKTQLVVFTETW